MLLGNQSRPYPSSEMFIEETCDVSGADVSSTFEKATSKRRDGVGVCLDQVSHDLCELDLIFKVGNAALLVREEGGEGVNVVIVDLSDVWVRDYDEGKVPESLNAVRESDG